MHSGRGQLVDEVDRRLLLAVRSSGRATYAELGRAVGLSAPAVHERVRRLEQAGVITGYHAAVDPLAVGLGVTALVSIYQTEAAEQDDVAESLRGVREIEDCWFVAGDEAFIVKVRTTDVDALEHVLAALRRLPGVARTRTTVVLSTRWEGRLGGVDVTAGDRPADAEPADVGSNRPRSREPRSSEPRSNEPRSSEHGGKERDGRRTKA
jgi:Lrp/AsnC family leucine-responsive transcriptional regulator